MIFYQYNSISSIFRNLMKLLRLNPNEFIKLLNVSCLLATYFIVRILPLPFVLYLYALQSGSIVDGSVYEVVYCILKTSTMIPLQCKLGCLVFYSLQLYWFFNIFRSWIRTIAKQKFRFSLLYKGNGYRYFKRDFGGNNTVIVKKKMS